MQYAAKCIDLHFEATSKESLSKAADMTRSDVQMGVAEADTALLRTGHCMEHCHRSYCQSLAFLIVCISYATSHEATFTDLQSHVKYLDHKDSVTVCSHARLS